MAARAFSIRDLETGMSTPAATQRILDAITGAEARTQTVLNALSISVAALDVKIHNMGNQVNSLASEVQLVREGKASRQELAASEARIEKELSRVEAGVTKDAEGFQGMYESLVGEMKDLSAKMDCLIAARAAHGVEIKGIDERLREIEPLRDTWLKIMGARWVIGLISALFGSASTAAIVKVFGLGK